MPNYCKNPSCRPGALCAWCRLNGCTGIIAKPNNWPSPTKRQQPPSEANNWTPKPDPACVCGKPLLLYVPPGQTAYPCRVHPERGIRGSDVTL